jgi:hypothetical protein
MEEQLIRPRFKHLLFLIALLCLANDRANADLISLQFHGYVGDVTGNPFGWGLAGGEPFSALFTYDTTTPPAHARTDQNLYYQSTGYAVDVAGHSFAPVANDWFVFMSDNAGGGDFITFSAGSYPAGFGTIAIDGIPQTDAGFIVYLIDSTGNLWNSVALPGDPFPPFSAFDQTDTTIFSDNRLGRLADVFNVTLTDVQQVPEPGTLVLLTLSLLSLKLGRRTSGRC